MNPSRPARGLTLIEVMITVAIVGVLTAIALPSYQAHVQRSHRSQAKAALLRVAQFLERAATANGVYPASVPASVLTVEGGRYAITLVSTTGTTFTATAVRNSATPQSGDACGDLRIDQAGNRTIVNAASGQTALNCWGR